METDHNEVELDPVLHALGPLGLFACVQCFLYFCSYLSDAGQLFVYVFIAQDVDHRCAAPGNDSDVIIPELHGDWMNISTVHYGQCFISVSTNVSGEVITTDYPCVHGMEYDVPKDMSIKSEFDLVCDNKHLASLTQAIFSLGTGVGAIVCPWLSDRYGRKRIIMIAQCLATLVSLAAGLAPSYIVFVIVKFFTGALMPGIGTIAVTAGIELFPSTHRPLTSGFWSTLIWAICLAVSPLVAFLFRFHSWRILQMVSSGYSCFVITFVFVKEPVRWLVANGKIKEAEKVLTQAARWNGKDVNTVLKVFRELGLHQHHTAPVTSPNGNSALSLPDNGDKVKDELLTRETEGQSTNPVDKELEAIVRSGHLGYRDLVRHKILRLNAILNFYIWFVDNLTYNALYLMSDTLAFSLYLSFFLNAVVEGASCILMVFMMNRVGRRVMIGVFHVIAGVGLITSSVCFNFQGNSTLQIVGTVLSLIGKMGIGGAFKTMFLYTPETFPTNIRNRALGICLAAATLGGTVAPYSNVLADYAVWAPGVLFGILSMCVVLVLLALPESRGKELPQTIRDLEAWYHITSADEEGKRSPEKCRVI